MPHRQDCYTKHIENKTEKNIKIGPSGGGCWAYEIEIPGHPWEAAKNRHTWSVWGHKQVLSKIKSKTHSTSPAIGPDEAHCTCFGAEKAQVHPTLSTLLDVQPFFCRFLANQRPSIVPPYAPHTYAGIRGDPLYPSASHTTPCEQHMYLTSNLRRDRYDIQVPICTMATDASASAASEIEVGSICPKMQELRAAAARQADTCIQRLLVRHGVRCGAGLPVRRHSYRGCRVEVWTIADWLNNDRKQPKVKQSRQLGCTRALSGTNRH